MPVDAQPPDRRGTVGHACSALDLWLAFAGFGLPSSVVFAVLLLRADQTVLGWLFVMLAVIAAVDLIVIQLRPGTPPRRPRRALTVRVSQCGQGGARRVRHVMSDSRRAETARRYRDLDVGERCVVVRLVSERQRHDGLPRGGAYVVGDDRAGHVRGMMTESVGSARDARGAGSGSADGERALSVLGAGGDLTARFA